MDSVPKGLTDTKVFNLKPGIECVFLVLVVLFDLYYYMIHIIMFVVFHVGFSILCIFVSRARYNHSRSTVQ